eukprot:TRINITY_DN23356_c0_g4_i1.p1 TRINITY_DN23356_c0_g4~~TRINITY_DN23356_c0_g4_i1.p1  ORF type:complete len:587 (-),score=86.48 TRINITY_DN23356_c0_g4_i1:277-2037(-)
MLRRGGALWQRNLERHAGLARGAGQALQHRSAAHASRHYLCFRGAGAKRKLLSRLTVFGAGAGGFGCWVQLGGARGGGSALKCEESSASAAPVVLAPTPPPKSSVKRKSWRRLFLLWWRCVKLFWHFVPVAVAAPWCWLLRDNGGERLFWRLALGALESAGPIAVKFAQWASTRPDILPQRICDQLAHLQADVQPHSLEATETLLKEALGRDWTSFLVLDPEPIGSGCMAQVYRGQLLPSTPGEAVRDVAVKVRHPGAQDKVDLDLEVMKTFARALESVWRGAQYLDLTAAIRHFEVFIRPQSDLRIEANNLETWGRNFTYRRTGKGLRVIFPEVLRPYVSESVLVETYEDATPVQVLLGQSDRSCDTRLRATDSASAALRAELGEERLENLRGHIGQMCLDAFLKMVFADNFIHGDLHPGNMHVRLPKDLSDPKAKPELVLLDAGLAVSLTKNDRRNFVEVFHALACCDGPQAAKLIMERSPGDRTKVRDPDGFVTSVGALVSDVLKDGLGLHLGRVRLGEVFSRLLGLASYHRVRLESSFVTVATSIIVCEGVGRQLDPGMDLAAAARPLLAEAVRNRIWQSAA